VTDVTETRFSLAAALALFIAVGSLAPVARADFAKQVVDSVQKLQEKIITSRRNINGAQLAATWALFDQDVLSSLNGGVLPLTQEALNAKYHLTDIRIPDSPGIPNTINTGSIRVEFFPLQTNRSKPDWLTVYYHGLGVVPASTFHIFTYKHDRYVLAAKMESTSFINQHPDLLWNGMQIQMHPPKSSDAFATYFVPVATSKPMNRSEVRWDWNGKRLKATRWTPEVDYHETADGTVASGRGPTHKVD
jgi:hypothetical protein